MIAFGAWLLGVVRLLKQHFGGATWQRRQGQVPIEVTLPDGTVLGVGPLSVTEIKAGESAGRFKHLYASAPFSRFSLPEPNTSKPDEEISPTPW